ncbi:MAG: Hint domain-containing protein, partial [Pseudomonadota bacterium]
MPDPFLSEVKYLGNASQDFIEVAVDAGTDVSNLVVTVYRPNGTVRSTSDVSLLTPTTVNGFDVYLIDNSGPTAFNGVALNQAVSLSEGSTVYQFVSFSDTPGGVTATTGPANGLTSTDIGQAGAGESLETQDQGGSYFTQTDPDPNNVTCFVAGTQIDTQDGPVAVEDLTVGTRVR